VLLCLSRESGRSEDLETEKAWRSQQPVAMLAASGVAVPTTPCHAAQSVKIYLAHVSAESPNAFSHD